MLTRIGLATAVALASAAAIALIVSSAPARGGSATLMPDLVTLPIPQEAVFVEPDEKGATVLRLSNEIGNRANGPLEVFPGPASVDCDGDSDPANDRDASQRIFADTNGSGGYEAGLDAVDSERAFGCMRYHAAHNHWHVLDIARYELRREGSGKIVAESRKVGFCFTDTRVAFPSAFTPPIGTYPIGSAKPIGCDATSTQGISAGWADLYAFSLPGQQIAGRRAAARQVLPQLVRRSARPDRRAQRGQQRAAGAVEPASAQAPGAYDPRRLSALTPTRRLPRAAAPPRPARRHAASGPRATAACRADTTRRPAPPCSRCPRR